MAGHLKTAKRETWRLYKAGTHFHENSPDVPTEVPGYLSAFLEFSRGSGGLFNVGTVAGLSDGDLLDRFIARRDESAEMAFAGRWSIGNRHYIEVMETPLSLDHSTPSESVARCRKLAKFLNAGRITFEEYASNVTLGAVYNSIDDIPACVATVPASVAAPYADYVRTFLEPVDFHAVPRGRSWREGFHGGGGRRDEATAPAQINPALPTGGRRETVRKKGGHREKKTFSRL